MALQNMIIQLIGSTVSPPIIYFMGKDKYENEDLIKWGWPEDVWFHVDKLSSAHVYLRLNPGQSLDDVPRQAIDDAAQLVKANSIEGCKLSSVDVVYTMWSNLKKTPDMQAGQVSFFSDKEVRKLKVEKCNEIVKRLTRTKREEEHPDFREQREKRDAEERAKQKKVLREQREKEKLEEKQRKEEAELKSYSSLMKSENMTDNKSGANLEDDFW